MKARICSRSCSTCGDGEKSIVENLPRPAQPARR
jgi:hypothetical protein